MYIVKFQKARCLSTHMPNDDTPSIVAQYDSIVALVNVWIAGHKFPCHTKIFAFVASSNLTGYKLR
jgi:hypothetical protein